MDKVRSFSVNRQISKVNSMLGLPMEPSTYYELPAAQWFGQEVRSQTCKSRQRVKQRPKLRKSNELINVEDLLENRHFQSTLNEVLQKGEPPHFEEVMRHEHEFENYILEVLPPEKMVSSGYSLGWNIIAKNLCFSSSKKVH